MFVNKIPKNIYENKVILMLLLKVKKLRKSDNK